MPQERTGLATCSHGLTYDATRQVGCVVCRREAGQPSATPPPRDDGGARATRRIYGAIVALAVLVGGGVAVEAWVSSMAGPSPGEPERGRDEDPFADERPPERVREEAREEAPDEPEEPASEPFEAERRAEALARARESVSVLVYVTSWCPHCNRAKAYMDAQHISYTAHDVETSDSARGARDRLNPRGSVPTFDIDGQVMVGFSPGALEQRIAFAAQQRVDRAP